MFLGYVEVVCANDRSRSWETMNSEEYNQWRARRGDEPGGRMLVGVYITDTYPSDEWRAREVEFVEEVETEAKEVYEERGPAGLEKERALIDDQVGDQEEQFRRVHLYQSGFELIASQIRLSYSDCARRVVEDLQVVPRGAFVRDPDGPDGLEGLQAPEGSLVLRPSGETYRLEPTVRLLEEYDMPTDVLRCYSFGLLQLTDGDTWEEAAAMVEEQVEFTKEVTQKARRELHFLQARRDVYDALLERRAKGKDMPWENAQGAARKATQETSTPAGWKKNAAMMHAYFSNNGAPANLGDVDEVIAEEGLLDSFSHDHTWRKLKEEGWASSEGNIQALVEALERWAEHFEEKHGEEEADWAAGGFNWPSNHNTG